MPEPSLVVDEKLVLRNEPLRRGAGKPHLVEQLFRSGGETVHVCTKHPNGISEKEYAELLRVNPKAVRWGWRVMRRNPGVYARGTVRHSDHDTITLPFWHRRHILWCAIYTHAVKTSLAGARLHCHSCCLSAAHDPPP